MKMTLILALLTFASCAHTKNQPSTQAPLTSPQPVATQHAAVPAMSSPKVSCSKDADIRTLEVVKKASGCSLQYDKSGKTASVASSATGLKHCEESESKIRTKLEKNGFVCK
jgi:hypothetical protein